MQVLKEPGKTAQSKSCMWLYRTSGDAEHPTVMYEYQPSRKAAYPAEFLKHWEGYLHADSYGGYHKLQSGITVVGCWAHLRRKFDEALKAIPEKGRPESLALIGKRYCDRLFELERDFAGLTPEERFDSPSHAWRRFLHGQIHVALRRKRRSARSCIMLRRSRDILRTICLMEGWKSQIIVLSAVLSLLSFGEKILHELAHLT